MNIVTRPGLLTVTALALGGTAAVSNAGDLSGEAMAERLMKLEAEVVELRSENAQLQRSDRDAWLTERRAAEVRSIVQDVLVDADTRASLLGSGMQAGYDNGFQIGDTTGNFLLQVNGQLQTRWMYNRQSDGVAQLGFGTNDLFLAEAFGFGGLPVGGLVIGLDENIDFEDIAEIEFFGGSLAFGDRHRSGFENPRTKLWFTGHILNPNWRYHIEADFGHNGAFTLLDAWIAHEYGDTGWVATIGQFKLPLLREELVDSRYQQTVERSLVNSYFTGGRSQGIMVSFEQDMLRVFGAFSNGANRTNNSALAYDTEYALTGRVEFLTAGNWGQFNEFRSAPGEEFGLLLGGAVHWQNDEYGTVFPFETETLTLTLDASAKFGGWNLFGGYVFNHFDVSGGGNFQNHAIVAQGGFHLTDDWEVFGRYEHVWWDSDIGDVIDDLSIVTIGVNHYMFNGGHSAKWTTDFGYAFNAVHLSDPRTGWRSDALEDGKDGQFVFRTQLQLAF